MFLCDNYTASKLPDVTIYAGDTTPWIINICKQNGDPYPFVTFYDALVKLTLMPFSVTNSATIDVTVVPPVLSIEGTVEEEGSNAVIHIPFAAADTVNLRGKFIYQVEISKEDEKRICQGFVTIKQNIDRA